MQEGPPPCSFSQGGSPDPACSTMIKSPDVVCASPRPSRRAFARRRPTRVMEMPVRMAPLSHITGPTRRGRGCGAGLPSSSVAGAMHVTGTDLAEIPSTSRAGVAAEVPPEHDQSFGGGGGDLLSLICPELGVTPLVDPGTDLEDELSIPASPPADVNHAVVSLSVRAEMEQELEQVFVDVGSLPTMVTPVCDPDGALRMTPAECPVIVAPGVSSCVIQPLMASSPAGAPESARLTSRSPEYLVHHMGREKALSAALQLQHDAGLILSNVQVLQ